MWLFGKRSRVKRMMKLTLTNGQEFTGKLYGYVGRNPWVSVNLGTEKVYFPHHCIKDVRVWEEVE